MPTYYTVVRCVPDPVVDERINIGVIVWGDGKIRARFVSDWKRVTSFGIKDVSFIRDFAQRIMDAEANQLVLPNVPGAQRFDEAALRRAIETWAGVIQFSEARASLREPDTVLEDVARRFLRAPDRSSERHRSRQSAAALTQRRVEEALEARIGERDARRFIRKNYDLAGKLEEHKVDVGVVNGAPHLAARGLSFEIQELPEMRHHYTDTVFAVTDLKERIPHLPFGVVVYSPRPGASASVLDLYKRAVDVLPRAGAIVVSEQDAATWAKEEVAKIPEEALGILRRDNGALLRGQK